MAKLVADIGEADAIADEQAGVGVPNIMNPDSA
jgi:hypothetical protein